MKMCLETVYDGTYEINSNFIIYEHVQSVYTHGHCFSAAGALEEIIGKGIVLYHNPSDGNIIHAFASGDGDTVYDINGESTESEFEESLLNSFEYVEEEEVEKEFFDSFEEMMKWVYTNFEEEDIKEQQLEFARLIVNSLLDRIIPSVKPLI